LEICAPVYGVFACWKKKKTVLIDLNGRLICLVCYLSREIIDLIEMLFFVMNNDVGSVSFRIKIFNNENCCLKRYRQTIFYEDALSLCAGFLLL